MSEQAASHLPSTLFGWPQHGDALSENGAGTTWLKTLRQNAVQRLDRLGLPDRGQEHWKYTRLNGLKRFSLAPLPATTPPSADTAQHPGFAGRISFFNGQMAEPVGFGKLPAGIEILSLARALETMPDRMAPLLTRSSQRTSIATRTGRLQEALGTAFSHDGYVILLPDNARISEPLHIAFEVDPEARSHSRHLTNYIVAGRNSEITLFEHHASENTAPSFANIVTTVEGQAGAHVSLITLQEEAAETVHLHTTVAELARDAHLDSFVLSLGGALARHESETHLLGAGAEVSFSAIYAKRARQHVDITSIVNHAHSDTHSSQAVRGVLDDLARAVFQGNITIQKDAQRVDGRQLSKALLLSDRAEVDTKPELRIHADDVKCSHGATTGTLDPEALFYLRSRGLGESAARQLLIQAFLSELVDGVQVPALQTLFADRLAQWTA